MTEPPTPETLWLRQLLHGVDVPQLEPIPPDHVVTKTFYLIDGFVGRYETGQTWIEALPPLNPADGQRPARAGMAFRPSLSQRTISRRDGRPTTTATTFMR